MQRQSSLSTFVLLLVLLVFPVVSLAQLDLSKAKISYAVDPKLKAIIQGKHTAQPGELKNSIRLRTYMDGRVLVNYFERPKFGVQTQAFIRGDSILLTGSMNPPLGHGFQLLILPDSAICIAYAQTDQPVYALDSLSEERTREIFVTAKVSQLTLSAKPQFRAGEVISGYIELISHDYYFRLRNGWNSIFRSEIRAYFETAPLKKENE